MTRSINQSCNISYGECELGMFARGIPAPFRLSILRGVNLQHNACEFFGRSLSHAATALQVISRLRPKMSAAYDSFCAARTTASPERLCCPAVQFTLLNKFDNGPQPKSLPRFRCYLASVLRTVRLSIVTSERFACPERAGIGRRNSTAVTLTAITHPLSRLSNRLQRDEFSEALSAEINESWHRCKYNTRHRVTVIK